MCCSSACCSSPWSSRKRLFAFLQRNAERSAAFFGVPAGQVVEFGTEIETLGTLPAGIDRAVFQLEAHNNQKEWG
jgi:hypothetical protein